MAVGSSFTLPATTTTASFADLGDPISLRSVAPGSQVWITVTNAVCAAPTTLAAVASGTGGTLATATYFYKATAVNAFGESIASTEASAAVTGPTGKVTLTWDTMVGATSYKLYRSVSTNTEVFLTTVATPGYVDTGSIVPSGASAPATGSNGVSYQVLGSVDGVTYVTEIVSANVAAGVTVAPSSITRAYAYLKVQAKDQVAASHTTVRASAFAR